MGMSRETYSRIDLYTSSGFDLTLEHLVVKNVPPMWICLAKART
ncbi:MAG: hypothetical protein VXZ28_01645 [Bacteroidota bacterium]|nr:hypothetical protein [Bacteroidota bacterium]MEC8400012.1 hypothetical protein [Bacteroidota bacterium]